MSEPEHDPPNGIVWFLHDLRDFIGLVANVLSDDDVARDLFGFSVSVDFGIPIGQLEASEAMTAEASLARADLVDLAELAERLAQVTETVTLLQQAVEANAPPGVVVQEVLGQFFDTVALAYVAGRWPFWLYLARLLGLLSDNLPQGETAEVLEATGLGFWRLVTTRDFDEVWTDFKDTMGADLQTEDDARRLSVLLALPGLAFALFKPLGDHFADADVDPRRAQVLFGWDPDPGTTTPVADDISRRFVTMMLRLLDEAEGSDRTVEILLTTAWVPAVHGGPGLFLSLGGGADTDFELGKGWHLVLEGELDNGLEMMIPGDSAPDGAGFFRLGTAAGGSVELRLERRDEGTDGQPASMWRLGSWLEARSVQMSLRASDVDPMLEGVFRVHDLALILQRPESGIWRHLVPEGGLRVVFDLGLVVDSSPRAGLEGGSGMTLQIPVRTNTPKVQGLHLFVALRKGKGADDPFTLEISAGFGLKLGWFSLVVDRLGIVLPRAENALDGLPWFRFPEAIGIGIDSSWISGGGFLRFDPDEGRYAGVLSLTVCRFTVTAFGLITDREGQDYSLLVVLSLIAKPPLELWIELNAIGGILGHNHACDVNALLSAVRTGAVRTMLFPADPIAAAPRVLTTLASVFPATPGSSLIGVALDLGWLDRRFSAVAAVIFESGSASRTLVLGSFIGTAPTREQPVIKVQIDVAGFIDPSRPTVEFDGSLVDSFIGPYTLTGDATFRYRGARDPVGGVPAEEDEGVFLMAIGGFHPAYKPPTSIFIPPQRRIALALPMENPRLRLELYAALTSNSLQLGARLEVSARKAGLTAEAILAFDTLVARNPFQLTVDIEARAAIKRGDTTLAGVGLDLHVDGPSPWHIHGTATLSLLFFSIPIPIESTFGNDAPDQSDRRVDAGALLTDALGRATAWQADAPAGAAALVAVRPAATDPDVLAVHPLGILGAQQDALPLGIEITHVGGARIAAEQFHVDSVQVNDDDVTSDDVRGYFPSGEFVDLTEDEQLSRPAFERFVSGFSVGSAEVVAGPPVIGDLGYEEIVLGPDGAVEEPPRKGRLAVLDALLHASGFGPAAISPLRRDDALRDLRNGAALRIDVIAQVPVLADTLEPLVDVATALTATEARQAMQMTAAGRAGDALVLSAYDLVGG
jgi:hypothetical protein